MKKNKSVELKPVDMHDKHENDVNQFNVIEAYKSIRTNVIFATKKDDGCKKIMITSPLPRDGKTTTSVNLAISLAQAEYRVMLIDCDLRKPRIHRFFNSKNTPGLSNYLVGLVSLDDIIKTTNFNNLSIITSGLIPPNPAELLSGARMHELLTTLDQSFDFIILDTSPVNLVSDSIVLSTFCDGVILLVKQDESTHPELVKAIQKLEFVKAVIFGIVLNEVTQTRSFYKSKYGRKYEYR